MRAWITLAAAVLTFTPCTPAQQAPLDPGLSPAVAAAVRNEPDARPRLVVLLSIDQFRADYLPRLHDLFGEGGFKRLTGEGGGAWFTNAHHDHYPLKTSPGHAAMLTGGAPYKTGIIGNSWWDPAARRAVESIDQPSAAVIGADAKSKENPAGPANLRSTTVGDELKLATDGRARVVSISLKSTAAILMGGHAADACIWFDEVGGRWISSSAYCRAGTLPAWVTALNDERIPAKSLGTTWECSLTPQTINERTTTPRRVSQALPKAFGTAFPHAIGAEDKPENYTAFAYTPASNGFIFQTAQRAVIAEKLGQRGGNENEGTRVPDLLAVSLSANDTVGHAFGPYSPQAIDIMVRTDAMLADFLTFLDEKVGKGKYLIALTGDHGIPPIPEDAAAPEIGMPARRFKPAAVISFISDTLTARYGPPAGNSWFSHYEDPRRQLTSNGGVWVDGGIYFSREATAALLVSGKVATLRDVEQLVCDAVNSAAIPGVYGCFGKKQVLEGRVADTDLRRHLSLGVHPQLSPDLIILEEQLCLPGEGTSSVTNHATPYAYDTHVPLILYQPGVIKPGIFAQRVSTMDIAPTISLLIGTQLPSACDGQPLLPALVK